MREWKMTMGVTGNQVEEYYECKELKKLECQLME